MKKIIPALVLAGYLVFPALAAAIEDIPPVVTSGDELLTKITSIGNSVLTILLSVAGVFLMISGFYFVTAQGAPDKLTLARQMLINALIGVGVALGATGMVAVIKNILTQ